MKNLFIAKNITEVDHFLPLMNYLIHNKEKVSLEIINININDNILKEKFSSYLFNGIEIKNFFFDNNIILKKIGDNDINFQKLKKSFSIKKLFISIVKFFIFGKLKLFRILLNKKILSTKLKSEKPLRVFIDNNFETTGLYNIISNICDKQNIILYELPHSLTLSKRQIIKKNKYSENIQVYNSEYEINQFVSTTTKYKILKIGSFKYDKWWQNILTNKFFGTTAKKSILYVMTDHFEKDKEYEAFFLQEMVNKYPTNFVVCPPSRDSHNFFYKNNSLKKFEKFFDFENSLLVLSQNADIFLTTISGGVIDGIYKLKPIIFLKFLIKNKNKNYRKLVFDDYDCFGITHDLKNFYKLLERIQNKKFLTLSKKKKYVDFLNKYILFNNSRNKILGNFYNEIKNCDKK